MRRHPYLILVLIQALLFISVSASAFIAPIRTDGERTYLQKVDSWQVAVARIDLKPRFDIHAPSATRHSWTVDAEFWLRNVSTEAKSLSLVVADTPAFTGETELFLDGQRVETALTPLTYDPRMDRMNIDSGRRFAVAVSSGGRVVIGVRLRVDAVRDDKGQYSIDLPTHLLQLLAPKIMQTFLHVDFDARPLGLSSTLSGFTFYDHPWNRLSWFALDWEPRLPLRIVWLESWQLLVKVAAVEDCPAPWDVVRAVSRSDLGAVRALLNKHDVQTLRFCASLPLVIHGYVFPSSRVRDQFAEIPLRRYLGAAADRGLLYRENSAFSPDDLPELEKIYWSTLTRMVEQGQP